MAAPEKPNKALQLIFAFFLGLMVTAFIGVGVYTFYPPDMDPIEERQQELFDQQSDIRNARPDDGFTEEQREDLDAIEEELVQVGEELQEQQEGWARTTSIVLILFATLVMGISLVRSEYAPVISNGLLLGGVFTMLYGTGWILASGDSRARFWVMVFALAVTLGLGWLRFVRGRKIAAPEPGRAAEVGDLAARVDALEQRMDAASQALREP